MESQSILDMCCGSRMFWFNKRDERAVFADIRAEEHILCDGRRPVISPDLIADFRALPFADASFPVVVFDPPHWNVSAKRPGWAKVRETQQKNMAF